MKSVRPSLRFALAAALLLWWLWPQPNRTSWRISAVRSASLPAPASQPLQSSAEHAATGESIETLNLAIDLNAPAKTIRDDLTLLDGVFSVWQTNFLASGNPVGTNQEITAALTGRNKLRVAFISPQNRAINRNGELCDRWGTPFFFHQISGTRMEIHSAGPDRRRGTDDDVVFSP